MFETQNDSVALLDFRCETGVFYDCQIRTVTVEDALPTDEISEIAIRQVQEKHDFRLKEYFLAYHNKEHGMGYDNAQVERWLAAEKDILEKAYCNKGIPGSAFVYVY